MNPSDEPVVLTPREFSDRVMGAVLVLPPPTQTRSFVGAMRARAVRDALAALWVAWHLGTVRTWSVAPRVRARSFALVLAVTSVLATGGLAAAAAVHSVVPQRDERVPVGAPNGSNVDLGPAGNGGIATDGPDEAGESPTTSDESDATDQDDGGATVDSSDGAGDGYATTNGAQPDDADDDHHDADEADDHDGGEPDEGDDGPDGEDAPVATEDHSGSDGEDEPDESDDPDGGDATDSSGSSDDGDAIDSSGSSGGAGEPDRSGEAEPGGD